MVISNLLKPKTDDNCYLPKQDFQRVQASLIVNLFSSKPYLNYL